jgi:WD40 repeat protein
VAVSPDGRRIASGGADRSLRLWDTGTGAPVGAPLTGHQGPVTGVAFVSEGSRVVSGSTDTQLRLWDAQTGASLGELLRGVNGEVTGLAAGPDGRQVVFSSRHFPLKRWDVERREDTAFEMSPAGDTGAHTCVAVARDGARVAVGTDSGALRMWSLATGRLVGKPMLGHRDGVRGLAFSPDGQRIASVGSDRTVRLWDAATGEPLGAPLQGHEAAATSVAFSPDGLQLVSGDEDGTLRVWPGPKAWSGALCAKLSRNMSPRQWREWVSAAQPYVCQCPGLPIPPDDYMAKTPPQVCGGPEVPSARP